MSVIIVYKATCKVNGKAYVGITAREQLPLEYCPRGGQVNVK